MYNLPPLHKGADQRSPEEILTLRKLRHRVLTQFSRRRKTVLLKADQLHRDCQADVYLVVRWEGKTYTYKSIDDKNWPPPEEELVSPFTRASSLIRYARPFPHWLPGARLLNRLCALR